MQAVFVETSNFTEWVVEFLRDDLYAKVQQELMDNPGRGDVMPGCGGLRKLRTTDSHRGKGKRGGTRIIYLYIPEAKCFYLLDIYGKDEKDDLSTEEKKYLKQLADELKRQVKAALERSKGKAK